MKDLIFLGGAKGVGKSTVAEEISERTLLDRINTGDIVLSSREEGLEPEKQILECLIEWEGLVDTHYAGYNENGRIIRAISTQNLKKLNKEKSIDLILLDLDPSSLRERRLRDSNEERACSKHSIEKELKMNRYYFDQYCKDLSVEGLSIHYQELNPTVNKILERIEENEK